MIEVRFEQIEKILSEKRGWNVKKGIHNFIFTYQLKNKLILCVQTCFKDKDVIFMFDDKLERTSDTSMDETFLNVFAIFMDDYGCIIGVKKSKKVFATDGWETSLKKIVNDMFDDIKYAHLNNDFVRLVLDCDNLDNQEIIHGEGYIYSVLKGTEIKHGNSLCTSSGGREYSTFRFNKLNGKSMKYTKDKLVKECCYKNGELHGLYKTLRVEKYYMNGEEVDKDVYLKSQYAEMMKLLL